MERKEKATNGKNRERKRGRGIWEVKKGRESVERSMVALGGRLVRDSVAIDRLPDR